MQANRIQWRAGLLFIALLTVGAVEARAGEITEIHSRYMEVYYGTASYNDNSDSLDVLELSDFITLTLADRISLYPDPRVADFSSLSSWIVVPPFDKDWVTKDPHEDFDAAANLFAELSSFSAAPPILDTGIISHETLIYTIAVWQTTAPDGGTVQHIGKAEVAYFERNLIFAAAPEPSSMALLVLGLLGVKKRRSRQYKSLTT